MDLREKIRLQFPKEHFDVWGYKPIGYHEVVVYMNNGSSYVFNELEHTTRLVAKDRFNITREELTNEFGRRLEAILHFKDIKQIEIGDVLHIHQSLISEYVNGRKTPTLYRVAELARAADCSIDDLTASIGW